MRMVTRALGWARERGPLPLIPVVASLQQLARFCEHPVHHSALGRRPICAVSKQVPSWRILDVVFVCMSPSSSKDLLLPSHFQYFHLYSNMNVPTNCVSFSY